MSADVLKKFTNDRRPTAVSQLPEEGWKTDKILERVQGKAAVSSKRYRDGGNLTGAVYTKDEKHWDFLCQVMRASIVSNPLHIDEFLYVTQMEAEILRWTIDLYNGGKEACGIVTSGGTESIILALLAYRE
jgi:sphinganine-1-phosphate aldolase